MRTITLLLFLSATTCCTCLPKLAEVQLLRHLKPGGPPDRNDGNGPNNPQDQDRGRAVATVTKPAGETTTQTLVAATSPSGGINFCVILGVPFLAFGLVIMWLNEERSARIDALLMLGETKCHSVDPAKPEPRLFGQLIHAQGDLQCAESVTDGQLKDISMRKCLKLQSTIEVLEWVPSTQASLDQQESPDQQKYYSEWTTVHHDSSRFRKPSPENPPLPSELRLGTFTSTCQRVLLGRFEVPQDLLSRLGRFQPAMDHLPQQFVAGALVFVANREDGYYYARPEASGSVLVSGMHQVGDLRARFMYVPEGRATIVAVQSMKDGLESFAPYRVAPRGACCDDEDRPDLRIRKEIRGESLTACCGGSPAAVPLSCCCCPCTTISTCFLQEVVTEEIYFACDQFAPKETPFKTAVKHRNPWRVWNLRALSMLVTFTGFILMLGPAHESLSNWPATRPFGSAAAFCLSTSSTAAAWAFVLAVCYWRHRSHFALQLTCAGVVLFFLLPVLGSLCQK